MQKLISSKKAAVERMTPEVMAFIIIGILIAVGLVILGNLLSNSALTPEAKEAVNDTITAMIGFTTWFTIIVVLIAAGVLIFLLFRAMSGSR